MLAYVPFKDTTLHTTTNKHPSRRRKAFGVPKKNLLGACS
jgi:hypothetical protein